MLSKSIILASVLAALADAQLSTSSAASVAASTTVSQSMPPAATAGFNPALVNSTVSFEWCHAQQNSCPEICAGAASTNTCDQETFTYSCICANGTVPDCTAYTQTLPFYICQETFIQCINAHPMDLEGQTTCTNDEQCGTKNASAVLANAQGAASSSAAASSTGSSGSAASSSGGAAATAASSAAASATSSGVAVATSQQIATGAFAAILMAAFKLFL